MIPTERHPRLESGLWGAIGERANEQTGFRGKLFRQKQLNAHWNGVVADLAWSQPAIAG